MKHLVSNTDRFNALSIEEQCLILSELQRKDFSSNLSTLVSGYLDQTSDLVIRCHALRAEVLNKDLLDLELSIITRNGEEEATDITKSVLIKLDNALDAEECIDSPDRLKVECGRLTARALIRSRMLGNASSIWILSHSFNTNSNRSTLQLQLR